MELTMPMLIILVVVYQIGRWGLSGTANRFKRALHEFTREEGQK